MKKLAVLFLVLLLTCMSLSADAMVVGNTAEPSSAESPGSEGAGESVFFEKPEHAVVNFAWRVASGDFSGALDTMADRSIAEAYDLAAQINRLRALSPAQTMPLPSGLFETFTPINVATARGYNARALYGFIASILLGGDFDLSRMLPVDANGKLQIAGDTTVTPEEFAALLDPARLEGLKLREVWLYRSEAALSEANRKNVQAAGAVSGYTDRVELAAVYVLDGELFMHPYTLGLFPEGWQIMSLNANLIGTPPLGNAVPLSEADIAGAVSGGDYLPLYRAE
jgi:hypothetical protein